MYDTTALRCIFRQLYPVLNQHAAYIGVWHTTADNGQRGALYSFRWAAAGVDVVQLIPAKKYLTLITHKRLCTLSPSHPRFQAEVVDGCKCVLRDYGSNSNGSISCSTAEAVASVAAGVASSSWTSSGSDGPSGSSPGSYWGAELLRFMQSSVQRVSAGNTLSDTARFSSPQATSDSPQSHGNKDCFLHHKHTFYPRLRMIPSSAWSAYAHAVLYALNDHLLHVAGPAVPLWFCCSRVLVARTGGLVALVMDCPPHLCCCITSHGCWHPSGNPAGEGLLQELRAHMGYSSC